MPGRGAAKAAGTFLPAAPSTLIRADCGTWLVRLDWLSLLTHLVRIGNAGLAQMPCVSPAQFERRGVIDFHFSDFLDGYLSTAQPAFVVAQRWSPGSGCRMSHPITGRPGSACSRSPLRGGPPKLLLLCGQWQDGGVAW